MEQEQISGIPAESDKSTENSYGKFRSAEELLKAYNALESEFTKRSQKLKEYEREKSEEGKSLSEKAKEFAGKYPLAETYADEVASEAARAQTHGKINLEEALINVLSRKIKTPDQMAKDETVIGKVLSEEKNREIVISGYLEKIRETPAPITISSGGEMPITPARKPSTIKEAGELAKIILQKL